MKFTLTIEFGNEGMSSLADVAEATKRIFSDFSRRDEEIEENEGESGNIYDVNGNKVGQWEVSE